MKLACCGDDCGACPRYTATLSGDIQRLEEAADLIKKAGWVPQDVTPEQIVCHGCESFEKCEYGVRECCTEHSAANCGECGQYPCAKIEAAFEKTRENAVKFQAFLTEEEYAVFAKAFFEKQANLNAVSAKTKLAK